MVPRLRDLALRPLPPESERQTQHRLVQRRPSEPALTAAQGRRVPVPRLRDPALLPLPPETEGSRTGPESTPNSWLKDEGVAARGRVCGSQGSPKP
jgi:hypothetical protein